MSGSRVKIMLAAIAATLLVGFGLIYEYGGIAGKKTVDVKVIIKSTDASVEFWQVLVDGVNEAALEFDVNVEISGMKTETDVDGQIALVEKAIEENPDAIVLAANDYDRLVPVAEKADKKGIELIIVDSGIRSDKPRSIVATDNFKAGREAGQELLKQLAGKGKVAIISYVKNAASQFDREKGVRSVLEASPDIELLDTYYAESSEEKAYVKAKQLLADNADIVGIVGLNEPTSVGTGRAIREMKLQDKVTLIGFDSSFNEITLLDEGVMKATVIQRPFQMGYLSVKTAVDAVLGKNVQRVVDTGSLVITKQNMYEEENQKLLFPFVGK
ncbi:substrate-binding domain-containing protein [Cohnella suwonensis]|uniref:Substrate-binding domain-containing protein n=1 Tax=Cohnella suwonensis TaxID=696072 RepID=A0ABW0LRR4_9BACL